MNTQLNIKTLLVLAVLVLGGSSVQAQTTSNTTATTDTASTSAVVDSSTTIAAKGSVSDPNGTITVTGDVTVLAKRVKDVSTTTTPAPPIVEIDWDFSRLQGIGGSLKAPITYVTGENHVTQTRPLQASDTITVTVPYFDSTKDVLSARSMLVTATLSFDTVTGRVTGGSITVGNNTVNSTAVGTFTTTAN